MAAGGVHQAIGYRGSDQARDILVSYLESTNPLERWASAIGLGRVHEERALPVLLTILTEFLPPDAPYASSPYYRGWRFSVPEILQSWGEPRFVPPLRHALQQAVRVEQALTPPKPRRHSERDDLVRYQDALVYALGRLGALGALTAITGAAEHLDIWLVHLAMGYLHGRHQANSIKLWADHPGLLMDVVSALEHYFGLTEDERQRCLKRYEIEKSFQIAEMYRIERERAEGKIF